MRTLWNLCQEGGDAERFATDFTQLHNDDWTRAKEHWTRTVQYIADRAKELDDLPAAEAGKRAENLARTLCLGLLQRGCCWACAQDELDISRGGVNS